MEWYWPTDDEVAASLPGYRPTTKGHPRMIKEAARLILDAERPVLYVGGGILKARAAEELRELAELTDIHVVTTLMARGAFPDDHPLALGMPGHARQRHRRDGDAAQRPADRPRRPLRRPHHRRLDGFAPDAKVIHVDIDPAEQGKVRRPDVPIVGDCKRGDRRADHGDRGPLAGRASTHADTSAWKSRISGWREQFPLTYEPSEPGDALKPQFCLEKLRDAAPEGTILTSGVGQHQMWASQYWKLQRALHVGQLGRPRHDGLLDPGRDRRQGRPSRPHRVGGRRRRLLPDDGPGAGDGVGRADPDQGRRCSTTATSAWSASGRRCSTTSATARCTCRPTRPTTCGGPRRWAASASASSRPRRSSRRSRRPTRSTTARSSSSSASTPSEKVFPMVPAGASNDDLVLPPSQQAERRSDCDDRDRASCRPSHHILSVLVQNRPGVLARVAGLFARRGFNIFSLAVAPAEDEGMSRITIVVDVESTPLEQITKQLFKLIEVVKISELDPRRSRRARAAARHRAGRRPTSAARSSSWQRSSRPRSSPSASRR